MNSARAVVTVSRQYGAGGRRVAEGLAEALGYTLVDREIADQAAVRVGMDPELAGRLDERTPSLIEEMGLALAAANPELGVVPPPLDERVLADGIRRVIESLAESGGYVVLGRGGVAVLRDHPRALHVQVVGAFDDRVARVVEWQGVPAREATDMCRQKDSERHSFVKRFFGADLRDVLLYDVVVNTSRLSFDQCRDAVVACCSAR